MFLCKDHNVQNILFIILLTDPSIFLNSYFKLTFSNHRFVFHNLGQGWLESVITYDFLVVFGQGNLS